MVHKDLAHQPRRYPEEVRPSLPVWAFLVDKPQVGLMHERSWLQGVPWVFLA
jgi:hypothetical protein